MRCSLQRARSLNSKSDIFAHKTPNDINKLSKLQYEIISTSSKYVKQGGHLVYSTCTILKKENQDIVDKFLKNNPDFESVPVNIAINSLKIGDYVQLMPHISDTNGFLSQRSGANETIAN